VVASLRGRLPPEVDLLISDGEPAGLIENWAGAGLAIAVDAIAWSQPGLLHRIVLAGAEPPRSDGAGLGARPAGEHQTSSHRLGLGTAVELAALLGRLPGTLIVHGVEAPNFGGGGWVSAPRWRARSGN
jgi:hydrogenase maturation protease